MGEVLEFIPQDQIDAEANLTAFIHHCRYELTTFGRDLDWDSDRWVLDFKMPGKNHFQGLSWQNWDSSYRRNGNLLQQPFGDFAKAYIRYRYAMTKKTTVDRTMVALRALERVLSAQPGSLTVVNCDKSHFDESAQLIKGRYKSNAAYSAGCQLQEIAIFLGKKNICMRVSSWKSPIRKNADMGIRIGKEFDQKRERNLPAPDAVKLLFKANQDAVEGRDVVIVSTAIILCSNPCRVSEVLSLPVDCEVERDGHYGLRWHPAKGAEPMVKWVYPAMVDVTKEAIRRIREASEPARTVAKFYEENPNELLLTPKYQYIAEQGQVEVAKLAPALGVELNDLRYVIKQAGIAKTYRVDSRGGRRVLVRVRDLARAMLAKLPKGFPILEDETGLKFSDALFVFPKYFFNDQRATISSKIQRLTQGVLSDGLGNTDEHYKSSLFYRLGYEGEFQRGDSLKYFVRTHQFRHLQDTIKHHGGVSPLDIALHAGRKDPKQNVHYDNLSHHDIHQKFGEVIGDKLFSPLAVAASNLPAVVDDSTSLTKDEFLQLNVASAHTTEFGYCIHNFAMSPCELHRDCVNCTEHVCIKGDEAKTERLRFQLRVVERQLAGVEKEIAEGTCGADRWYEKHKQTYARLKELVAAMDDDSIPAGSLIQLSGIQQRNPTTAAIDGGRPKLPETFDEYLKELHP